MIPYADLHCHSTCSDGSASPEEILALAAAKGFKGVSITDHDTVEAYKGLDTFAQSLKLEVLTGVEFSCGHNGTSVHILGYGFDLKAPALLELIKRHKLRRTERNRAILKQLAQREMIIMESEIQALGGPVIGRPHIALAMVKKGYVENVPEAFRRFIGDGRSCFASGVHVSVEETLAILKTAGGKAVIAHPHLIHNPKIFQDLLQMPFDGLECYYANFTPARNQRFIDLAKRKGWLETGGSDYHGSIKPAISYGASYVDEARFQLLQH